MCCAFQVIGTIDGSGKIVLKDKDQAPEDPVPVDLDLEKVLGDMPRKTYNFTRSQPQLQPHHLPQGTPPHNQPHGQGQLHTADLIMHLLIGALLIVMLSFPLPWV